jgi:hypothetical protein
MNVTRRNAGQEEGTMNWPVGDSINGPASLTNQQQFDHDAITFCAYQQIDHIEKVHICFTKQETTTGMKTVLRFKTGPFKTDQWREKES